LAITLGAHRLYLLLGIAQKLWAQGIWLAEKNVLYISLILWMIYIALVVANRVETQR
jgi:hypothetical protein